MGNEHLRRLLLEHNPDVNIQDGDGSTPLHWCAIKGNGNLCRLLLEHNADVNIRDKHGYTPLHWPARVGNEHLCRLLLEHNAMPRHPKFELSSAQNAIQTKYTTGVASVQGAEKLKASLKSEKRLRQNPWYTHTTLKTEELGDILLYRKKELEKEPEKYTTGVASVQGAEKLKSNLKSEKTLRQNPSYTHTTLKTEEVWETPLHTKEELEKEQETEQVKTLAVRHPKSKATTSSRTNKCVMA